MLPDETRRAVVTEDLADPMHRSPVDSRHPAARDPLNDPERADDSDRWAAEERRTDEPLDAVGADADRADVDRTDVDRADVDRTDVDRADADPLDRAGYDDTSADGAVFDDDERSDVTRDDPDGRNPDLDRDGLDADATRADLDQDETQRRDPDLDDDTRHDGQGGHDTALGDETRDAPGHDDDLTDDQGHHDLTRDDTTHDTAAVGSTAAIASTGHTSTGGDRAAGERTALFGAAEAEGFRDRWRELQIAFVDEPRSAVQNADELVAEVMQTLAGMFAASKQELEGQWRRDGEVETEDLRLALQRYRSFFDQLLRT